MTRRADAALLWGPRLLGILMSLFLALFALDAFSEGKPLAQSLAAFAVHLIPALALLVIVALAWRWEWIGGVTFIVLAGAYVLSVNGRLDWSLVIAGPLFVIGAFFLWSWVYHDRLHAAK
jgi:hypothetical protein